ncbi:hypothetical protein ACFV2H_39555 [Streptomyces sp. NPDC059629]|uniref:hypothetical protein n=1 Tax=Streptomyces sp. NPDC059629 TaxID=3346889 RepID=UPI0036903277
MPHCIAHIFEPLLRLLWPAPGRHRRPDHSSAGLAVEASTACPARVPDARVLRGEEIGLVRPYLVAHERREAQKQQARRRTLRLAVRGIDISPRLFDGVEVTA